MRYLLDTHLILWAAGDFERLPRYVQAVLKDGGNEITFSVASLWEIVIKNGQGRSDFVVDAAELRQALADNDFRELPVLAEHVLAVEALPFLHKDPFDRLLLAQAIIEGLVLLTSNKALARYPGPVQAV
ncbi:type II toxin-antitoxin system VapC family toxin [Methylocystis sp. JAN1]|uniref:type II toxin-antitoxin system VapC family toxin n=1 Tax=Methylocystis sp. JAN1 TaxID=3397211 RepID=UPI003FA1A75A